MNRTRRTPLSTPPLCLAFAVFFACMARTAAADDKIPVRSLDDLPRHTYKIPGTATELLKSDQQFAALARQVRTDIDADLEKYEIEDATALQRLHGVLLSLDLLEGRHEAALKNIARVRELEDKEAKKLMTGLVGETIVAARRAAGDDQAKFRQVFRQRLLEKVSALPWGLVGDDVEQRKGQAEILGENLLMGVVMSTVDPVVAKADGQISADIARQLVNIRFALEMVLPLKEDLIEVYSTVITQQRKEKKDIWAERSVTLSARQKLTPVVVAIWDSGVDTKIFPKQLFVNPNEKPTGKDDDGNGFVDDVHGIAFDIDANRVPELLHPLDDLKADVGVMTRHMKGFMDIQAAIESPEASAAKRMLAGLKPDQVKAFFEDFGLFGGYSHGTHVAGIAVEGNPFARILAARLTFDYHMIPKCPTIERAKNDAAAMRATVDYFKHSGARVVNMSWGESRSAIESNLEKNGVGKTAEERAELSRKIFKIVRDALHEAIEAAPDILFVTSAGNADNDVEFDEMIPSAFDLPNLLVVGAVDQAGDPTNFTSLGKTVQVYANGFEVDSYIPGGKRIKFSGTSMSSPNVANLAAKLLAHDPSLKPAQIIELIEKGADKVAGPQPMRLINPKRTVESLNRR